MCYFMGFLIVFSIIFFIMFGFLSEAEIPVKSISANASSLVASTTAVDSSAVYAGVS